MTETVIVIISLAVLFIIVGIMLGKLFSTMKS
jgi:hypothetical protein